MAADRCASCEAVLTAEARWCGSCGAAVRPDTSRGPGPDATSADAVAFVSEDAGGRATVDVLEHEAVTEAEAEPTRRRSPFAKRLAAGAVSLAVITGLILSGDGDAPAGSSSVGGDAAGTGRISATAPEALPTEVAWSVQLLPAGDLRTTLQPTGAHVIAHTEQALWVRDASDGEVLWTMPRLGAVHTTAGVLIQSSSEHGLTAHDLDTGEIRWSRPSADGVEIIDDGLGGVAVRDGSVLEIVSAALGETRDRLDLTGERGPDRGLTPGEIIHLESDGAWLFATVRPEADPEPQVVAFERDRLRPRWVLDGIRPGPIETAGEVTTVAVGRDRVHLVGPDGSLMRTFLIDDGRGYAVAGTADRWTFLRARPQAVTFERSDGTTGVLFEAVEGQSVHDVTVEDGEATVIGQRSSGEFDLVVDVASGEVVRPIRTRTIGRSPVGFDLLQDRLDPRVDVDERGVHGLRDGEVAWTRPRFSSPGGRIVVDRDDVVVPGSFGFAVLALEDGAERWSVARPVLLGQSRNPSSPPPRESAPVLTEDLIIGAGPAPGEPQELTAYDRGSGVVRWREDAPQTQTTTLGLTHLDGLVVGATEGEVRGFDAQTGERVFDRTVRKHLGATAATTDIVVAGPSAFERANRSREHEVHALDRTTGEEVWTARTDGMCTAPAIAQPPGEPAVVLWGTRTGLQAHDLEDGAPSWTTERTGAVCRELALTDEDRLVVAVGSYDTSGADEVEGPRGTFLTALNLADRSVAWRAQLGSPIATDPVVAGDHVLVGLADGRILALHGETGETVSTTKVDGVPATAPALGDEGTLVVLLTDGRLVALR